MNMKFPGENLLIRLWDTLAEKGVATLLTPWQIKREGLAKLEVRRAEILTIAQTEFDVQEIRNGNKRLEDFSSAKCSKSRELIRVEPTIDSQQLISSIEKSKIREEIRKEVNIANAILIAEEILKEDMQEPSNEFIEDDWLYRWRDYAANFSNIKLQELWGKALAGELKAPGTYSIRCLDFLKSLSQDEAYKIQLLSRFAVENIIWRDKSDHQKNHGLSYDFFLELQDLGLISGVESIGFNYKWPSAISGSYSRPLQSNGKLLIVRHPDQNKEIVIKVYKLTKIGQQVLSLGKFEPDIEYLTALGREIISQGFNVTLADVTKITDNEVEFENEKELSKIQ